MLPSWVRPSSSPPRIIGTPCDSSSVASRLRRWRARSARIAGSAVGPSTPLLAERLSSVPSRSSSPLAVVVLVLVGDEVGQREAVVGGHEVDRRRGPAAAAPVEVAGPGQARGEVGQGALGRAPEVAHRVAVAAVPLAPAGREVADPVAAGADVPGLGDQLDAREHRVLAHRGQEQRVGVELARAPAERGRQVEAEAVDVHLLHPVAQRVHHQAQRLGAVDVERVAAAGVVHIQSRILAKAIVGGVVDAPQGQRGAVVVALGGVVEDHVEDHLEAGGVQGAHHRLELVHLLAAAPRVA